MKALITTLIAILTIVLLSAPTSALPTSLDNGTLIERQTGCTPAVPCSQVDGTGNPRQKILHKQLGGLLSGAAGGPQRSYTLTADSKGLQWTDGDFDVVQSLETGTKPDGCDIKLFGGTCAFAEIWFTEYDVKTGTRNTCFPGCDFLDTATFRSPNALHDGHITYYCAYGAECSTEPGAERWVDGPAIPPPAPAPAPEAAALIERQGCVPSGSCTRPEGDGDPHQWILTKQLSAKKDCGDDNCAVQENEQINYKIRANTNGLDWISGGFDVQESVDAGFHNECVGGGNNPGRSVCVKAVFWHTDYTVRGGIANQCATDGCLEDKDTTIFRSPNQIRVRVEYYCAWDDDCADQGAESWAYAQEGPPPSPAPKRALDPAARDETLEYEPSHSSALEKRDDDCPIGKDCFGLWQNGAVKQMILHKQISDPYACAGFADDPGCPFDGKTKSWDAPIRYDGDKVKWSDLKNVIGAAGWPVEKSIKTGQPGKDGAAPDCAAKPGETVCLFADLWHTQFSTNYGQLASCDPYLCNANSDGFTQFVYEVTAPNALKGPNVNYVCGYNNECGENGYETLLDAHVPGGPP